MSPEEETTAIEAALDERVDDGLVWDEASGRFGVDGRPVQAVVQPLIDAAYTRSMDGGLDPVDRHDAAVQFEAYREVIGVFTGRPVPEAGRARPGMLADSVRSAINREEVRMLDGALSDLERYEAASRVEVLVEVLDDCGLPVPGR